MKKTIRSLDKYNLIMYISKLRGLIKKRLILNRQLDEVKAEYMGLKNNKNY
jgi:hypothetical protein